MKKRLFSAALMLLLSSTCFGEMTESLKSQCHTEKELGIKVVGDENLAEIPALLENPETKILAAQISPEKFDDNLARQLLSWVRKGHTLWFYEAQIGPKFGFEPIYLKKEQFTNKPESGDLGGRSIPGVATIGMALGKHETINGVGQVTVFIPIAAVNGTRVEADSKEATYGAVKVSGDVQPLLRFKVDSPAVAALRREGRGAILFKPLLWTEPMSGQRFQANLLEYSAGFPVPFNEFYGKKTLPPGPTADYIQGKPAIPLVDGSEATAGNTSNSNPQPSTSNSTVSLNENEPIDTLEMNDGSKVKCKVVTGAFRFETGNSNFAMQSSEINRIDINPSLGLDKVLLRDGKTKQGLLVLSSVKIEINGQERELGKRQIRSMTFGVRPAPVPQTPKP